MSNKPKNPAPLWRKILAIVLLVVLCIELYFIIKPDNKHHIVSTTDAIESANINTEEYNESTQASIQKTTITKSNDQETPNVDYSIEKDEDISVGVNTIRKSLKILINNADKLKQKDIENLCKTIVEDYTAITKVCALTLFLYDDIRDIDEGFTLGKCEYYPKGDIAEALNVTAGDYSTFTYNFTINERDASKKPTDIQFEIYYYLNDLLNDGDGSFEYEDECEKKTAETFNITQDEVSKIWLKVYGYKHN